LLFINMEAGSSASAPRTDTGDRIDQQILPAATSVQKQAAPIDEDDEAKFGDIGYYLHEKRRKLREQFASEVS